MKSQAIAESCERITNILNDLQSRTTDELSDINTYSLKTKLTYLSQELCETIARINDQE